MDCDDMDCDVVPMDCDDMDCDDIPPYLPIHIIEEIIVRLPVKSLLQIRCVCKSWQALTYDPIFIQRHLRASTKKDDDDDYEHKRLLVMPDFAHFNLKSCSLSSNSCSVNGLVCIIIDNKVLVIWNPCTGKSKRLPNCGFKKSQAQYIYEFGYDEVSSDYKVVAIKSEIVNFQVTFNNKVKLYGLKSDSWKNIGDFSGIPLHNASSIFVSGSLHWISVTGPFMKSVISLDLSKETYSTIVEPSYGEGYREGDGDVMVSILGVLSGNLCMLSYMDAEYADLWVMKEYGKVESWYKLCSMTYLQNPLSFLVSSPLYISKKNEVVLLLGSRLISFNIDSKIISYPDIHDCFQVRGYLESLVSPCPEL
ncbi:F-box/kelch-repeat protein At3g23880-like [Impatiens glandulifera]|uniref:F-box/kelch-repeat protein At3g23880-like n=1 Tax=Impatiens glandulifera TaxID=253017 RepID=UPI001FB0B91A|nr:F-box/kelch-repeat protein At3g23880-like [Impatiens glandulifera]